MNWSRRERAVDARASVRATSVLPTPGTSSMSTWPSATSATTDELERAPVGMDDRRERIDDGADRHRGVALLVREPRRLHLPKGSPRI